MLLIDSEQLEAGDALDDNFRGMADPQKIVCIPARGLAGQHKRFWRDDRAARRAG
jgi:hypothetical protein